jgi:hypothetical protein
MSKKVKTSQWVPVNTRGEEWGYFKPGVRGSRDAHGYVAMTDCVDRWWDVFMYPPLTTPRARFLTIVDAASYLKACVARENGKAKV